MAKSCPNCGTLAVSTDEMYQSRRVYACSEGICGLKFITKSGKLIRVSQTPWIKYEEDKKDNKM
jgi:transcription elongation factor Elf1